MVLQARANDRVPVFIAHPNQISPGEESGSSRFVANPLIAMEDPNSHYRMLPDWADVRAHWVERAADIPPGAEFAGLGRTKASHRGIAAHTSLTTLFTASTDQAYLDEIGELEALEYLWLGWPTTARDLTPLTRLKRLRFLKLDSPRAVTDFAPLALLPALTHLFIENAKHLGGLDWLAPLKGQLTSLGIEGSMWTEQKVPSLAPLAGFAFEALCLTSTRLADKDLTPLATCPNLRFLSCARFAPKAQFDELKALRPDIACSWFDRYDV
jgi:hypothetical protein